MTPEIHDKIRRSLLDYYNAIPPIQPEFLGFVSIIERKGLVTARPLLDND